MSRAGFIVVTLLFVLVIIGGGVAGYLSVDHPVVAATTEVPAVAAEKKTVVATPPETPASTETEADDISVADTAVLAEKFGPDWLICEERGPSLDARIAACDRLLAGEGLTKRMRARAVTGKGDAYYNAQKYDKATQAFMMASKIDDDYASARAHLGRLALMTGRPREALILADEALARYSGDPFTYCLKARALEAMRKFSAAIAVLDKVPPEISNDTCVQEKYADIFAAMGEPEKAIEHLNKVQGDPVSESAAQCHIGQLHWQAGRKQESLDAYLKGVELNPDNKCAVGNVARLISDLRTPEEAIAVIDRNFARHPDMIDLQCYKAAAVERVDWEEARQFYDKILEEHPDNACSLQRRAHLIFRHGDYDGALEAYDALLKRDPGNAEAWDGRGFVQYYAGRSEAAVEDYTNALKLDSTATDIRMRRGFAYQAIGRYDDAAKDFERVLKLLPGNREAARFLAEASLAAQKPDVTVSVCGSLTAADGSDIDGIACQLLHAQGLLMKNQTAAAISALDRFAAEGGEGAEANLQLAVIHLLSGDASRAEQILSAYRSANPADPYGALWLALLKEAMGGEAADLDTALAHPDVWPQPVLQHIAGRIDVAALVSATAVPDFKLTQMRETEAAFYLGIRALLRGDDAAAGKQFGKVLAAGVTRLNKNSYPALYRHSNQMEVALAAWLTSPEDSHSN